MTKSLTAHFVAELMQLDVGVRHHLLPVPEPYAAHWKAAKVRRLIGTVNGVHVRRALKNHADGGSFILVGKDLMRDAGLKRGMPARVELMPDPAPDDLDIPPEFSAVLEQDPLARARWETFTVGRQRSLLHYVASGRREDTRIKRSLEMAAKIRSHRLHADRTPP